FGSLFGGIQIGYNYPLTSRLLLGLEADVSFPNYLDDGIVATRSTPAGGITEKLDFVSTVRGRVGYTVDHWLFYATGGLAWSLERFLNDSNSTGNEDKIFRLREGWALGAGAELAITPGWTARFESTIAWAKPAVRSRRVPVMNRQAWISIVFGLGST